MLDGECQVYSAPSRIARRDSDCPVSTSIGRGTALTLRVDGALTALQPAQKRSRGARRLGNRARRGVGGEGTGWRGEEVGGGGRWEVVGWERGVTYKVSDGLSTSGVQVAVTE